MNGDEPTAADYARHDAHNAQEAARSLAGRVAALEARVKDLETENYVPQKLHQSADGTWPSRQGYATRPQDPVLWIGFPGRDDPPGYHPVHGMRNDDLWCPR